MCQRANVELTSDVRDALTAGVAVETSAAGAEHAAAHSWKMPMLPRANACRCARTPAWPCSLLTSGKTSHIEGGLLDDAINEGVRTGYKQGLLTGFGCS